MVRWQHGLCTCPLNVSSLRYIPHCVALSSLWEGNSIDLDIRLVQEDHQQLWPQAFDYHPNEKRPKFSKKFTQPGLNGHSRDLQILSIFIHSGNLSLPSIIYDDDLTLTLSEDALHSEPELKLHLR